MPRKSIPSLACGLGLALAAGPALAQGASPPLLLHPAPMVVAEASPDAILVPPAVFGGPAYGISGYGYYYDGPGESPLIVPASGRHAATRRAR